jgi:predicted porin
MAIPSAWTQTPSDGSVSMIVPCVSKQGERQVCKADTSAGVALSRSTGDTNCLLGRNWGYDSAGIWVSDGCGGEFTVGATKESAAGLSNVGTFEAYGQIRTHLAAFQNDAEVQDNATRVGINFTSRSKIKVIAGMEWGVNLVRSETQFNLSASRPDGFGTLDTTTTPVFLARLGFAGIDAGPLGRVVIGKQYAVHYDIASYTTDRFNVFGGQGTHAYVAGTDGGETGTGRADRIVQYRNTALKFLEFAAQGQFGVGDGASSGVGASLQIKPLPGFRAGATYTRTNWSSLTQQQIRGLGGDSDYMAAGARLDWSLLQLGFVYSRQHNGDIAFVALPVASGQRLPIVYDAWGTELYARVGTGRWGVIGGWTSQDPKVTDPLLDPNFRTRYFILGAEWFFSKSGKIYSESRIDVDSVTAAGDQLLQPIGQPGYHVFTIGFRYDFSWRTGHQP